MSTTDTAPMRNALAQRAASTDVATVGDGKPKSAAQIVSAAIDAQSAAFKTILPSHVDPARFSRLVLSAVKATPQLMECFATPQGRTTVLLASMQAAAIGLEPNTPTQECWLLPRKNRGVTECQLSIGYRGFMKLARRGGTIKTIFADVVHERDEFRWSRGLEEDELHHVPFDGDEDPGKLTHTYAVVRYKEGGYSFIVLNERDVHKRRAMSDSWKNEKARPYSPWTKWTAEMWRKSALRALVPFLDLSPEAERAIASDEARLELNEQEGVIEAFAEPFQHEPPAGIDVETGEVVREADVVDATAEPAAVDEPSGGGDAPPSPVQPMTAPQSKALHALLRDKYAAVGPKRHEVLSELLGRPVTSTKELSIDDASRLIDQMNELPNHEPDGGEG